MTPVHLSDMSLADLAEIWAFIGQDSPHQADLFIDKLVKAMDGLAGANKLGRRRPEIGSTVRSFIVRPFVIYYRPVSGGIFVLRVIHGARRQPDSL